MAAAMTNYLELGTDHVTGAILPKVYELEACARIRAWSLLQLNFS